MQHLLQWEVMCSAWEYSLAYINYMYKYMQHCSRHVTSRIVNRNKTLVVDGLLAVIVHQTSCFMLHKMLVLGMYRSNSLSTSHTVVQLRWLGRTEPYSTLFTTMVW